jgi:hypothetical protein
MGQFWLIDSNLIKANNNIFEETFYSMALSNSINKFP